MKYIVLVYYSSVIVRIIFILFFSLEHSSTYIILAYFLSYIYIYMVADIEMVDHPHDDPEYMKDAIKKMIDDGSQYFIDYNEMMQDNPTEQQEGNAPKQQEGNAPKQQLVVQQEGNTGEVCKCKHI